jgi:hypothetical protein
MKRKALVKEVLPVHPAPPRCRWYLADDTRTEAGGKITLLGLYPDDAMIVEMPAEAPMPTADQPILIEGLTILCVLSGFQGSAEFEFTLGDPSDGLTRKFNIESVDPNGHLSIASRFRPSMIHSFGKKTFSVACPSIGFREEFHFSITRRDVAAPTLAPTNFRYQEAEPTPSAATVRAKSKAAAKAPSAKRAPARQRAVKSPAKSTNRSRGS